MKLDFRQIPDLAPLRGCLSGYREALPLCKGLLYYYRNPDGKKLAEILGMTYGQLQYLHDKAIKRLGELLHIK